jgi:hypothetical protein
VSLQPPYSLEPDFIRLPKTAGDAESLVTDGSWLYWMDEILHETIVGDWHYVSATHSVGRARVDGTDVEPDLFQPEGGDDSAWLLGVEQGHLWWYSRRGTGSVGRARLDGSDVERAYLKGIQVYAGALTPGGLYYTGSACNEPDCVDVDGAIRRIALEPAATPELIARLGSGAGSAIALDSLGPQPGAASTPSVDKGLSITYGSSDFNGRERSVLHSCQKHRQVKVVKARKHRKDRVIGRDRTNRRGRYKVHAGHVNGRFYARAPKDGNCAKERSREIGV